MEWLILLPLVLSTALIIANAVYFKSLSVYGHCAFPAKLPKVSLLIPARNEAANLEGLLPTLLAQDYPNLEILLLDDHSTDATQQIAQRFAATDPRLRVLQGAELLTGWLGKPNACRQLSEAATGEILIFTDADTTWQPSAVTHTVKAMQAENADALCAWPKQLFSGWFSSLVHPLMLWGMIVVLPTWLVSSSKNPMLVSANGQMLAFTRAAFETIGGFYNVRDHILEDIALARLVKASGLRFVLLSGVDDIACTMYSNSSQALAGFAKNVYVGMGKSVPAMLGQLLMLFVLFVFPWFWLGYAWLTGSAWHLALLAVGLGVFGRLISDLKFRFAPYLCLLQPFSILLYAYIAVISWWQFRTGRTKWKDRVYQLNRPS